jgi:hypothetical protein
MYIGCEIEKYSFRIIAGLLLLSSIESVILFFYKNISSLIDEIG